VDGGLRWNASALTFLDLRSTDLNPNANFRNGDDYLWMSWAGGLSTDEVVSLRFRAEADGELQDYISLANDDRLADEVYTKALVPHPLLLSWNNTVVADGPTDEAPEVGLLPATTELLGVLPNPAQSFTRIGVHITQTQRVKLVVTDLSGRLLMEASPELEAGEQWVRVEVQDWPAGAYLFRIQTTDGPLSGRIIRQ